MPPVLSDIRLRLGIFPNQKLPPGGTFAAIVDGWIVYVRPIGKKTRWRRMEHRVRAICPQCDLNISAGRIAQHVKSHH